ncbi:MAG TPA: hypothetical protein VLU95_05370, partial [Candidatus Acidoferrum sp.]|nr:hypothetical protein [Candidatus Acidoferrum sp.]
GMIFDQTRPKEIVQNVSLLLDNADLRKNLGENAYEYVKSHLSWEKYAKAMATIFEDSILAFKQKS